MKLTAWVRSGLNAVSLLGFFYLLGCGSKVPEIYEQEHENIKRDYEVRDASIPMRPGWVADASDWAKAKEKDNDTFHFFSFETDAKIDREMACSLAKAQVKGNIAGEIATFIEHALTQNKEGTLSVLLDTTAGQKIREFINEKLEMKAQALVHGASIEKTYWEKRQYLKELGAPQDFTGFTCAVLVKMERKRLTHAIDRATELVVDELDNEKDKAVVRDAVKSDAVKTDAI